MTNSGYKPLVAAAKLGWLRVASSVLLASLPLQAPAATPCLQSEIANNPDLSLLGKEVAEAVDFKDFKLRQIRYDFVEETPPGRRPLIRIVETLTLDLTQFRNSAIQEIYSSISNQQTCNTRMRPHSGVLSPTAAGDLSGTVSIETTFRTCTIFDRPCFKGLEWHSCREVWTVDILSHTFGVNISSTRDFKNADKDLIIRHTADFDRRGFDISRPLPNLLLNIIGVATFNVGSKWILDNYRSKLGDINRQVMTNIPEPLKFSRGLPPEIRASLQSMFVPEKFTFDKARTKFLESSEASDAPYLAFQNVTFIDPQQKNTVCVTMRPIIAMYAAYLRSTATGPQAHAVSPGERMWDIAERYYGNGKFFLSLLKANSIPIDQADHLVPGQTLQIPAMYTIWNGRDYVVDGGDSLWSIAGKTAGDGRRYGELLQANRPYISSPDMIYPVQLFDRAK